MDQVVQNDLIVKNIFAHLPALEVFRNRLISKNWYAAACRDLIQRPICDDEFRILTIVVYHPELLENDSNL